MATCSALAAGVITAVDDVLFSELLLLLLVPVTAIVFSSHATQLIVLKSKRQQSFKYLRSPSSPPNTTTSPSLPTFVTDMLRRAHGPLFPFTCTGIHAPLMTLSSVVSPSNKTNRKTAKSVSLALFEVFENLPPNEYVCPSFKVINLCPLIGVKLSFSSSLKLFPQTFSSFVYSIFLHRDAATSKTYVSATNLPR